MAFHLHHPKLVNTTPQHMLNWGFRILKAWQKNEKRKGEKKKGTLWLTDTKIAQYLAYLNPEVLAAKKIRCPFRTSCTNLHLRWLFYEHAAGINYHNKDAIQFFPKAWNDLINELWPGDGLAPTKPRSWEVEASTASLISLDKNDVQAPADAASFSRAEETAENSKFHMPNSNLPAKKRSDVVRTWAVTRKASDEPVASEMGGATKKRRIML